MLLWTLMISVTDLGSKRIRLREPKGRQRRRRVIGDEGRSPVTRLKHELGDESLARSVRKTMTHTRRLTTIASRHCWKGQQNRNKNKLRRWRWVTGGTDKDDESQRGWFIVDEDESPTKSRWQQGWITGNKGDHWQEGWVSIKNV